MAHNIVFFSQNFNAFEQLPEVDAIRLVDAPPPPSLQDEAAAPATSAPTSAAPAAVVTPQTKGKLTAFLAEKSGITKAALEAALAQAFASPPDESGPESLLDVGFVQSANTSTRNQFYKSVLAKIVYYLFY
jgi:hypothetical protein